jgi:hypothetical protein
VPQLQINKMTGTHKKCIKMGERERRKEGKKEKCTSK